MIAETERLILRRFRKSDLEDMYEYLSNADVAKYMTMDEVEKMLDWRISTDEMIATAFCDGIHRIVAECEPQNVGSWKVLEALGFKKEAHLKKNVYYGKDADDRPVWEDTYIYAKLNERWSDVLERR